MEEETVTKVVTTLNAGAAKPIPVNSTDAQVIAAEQAKVQQQVVQTQQVVQPQPVQTEVAEQVVTPVQQTNQVDANVMAAQANQQNQQIDVSQLNEVNDLVMIKEVKSNPKTVIILACVIAVIIGVIIYELFAYGIL